MWGRHKRWICRHNEALWPYANAWSALSTLGALPEGNGAKDALPHLFHGLGYYHRRHRRALVGETPVGFESVPVFPHGPGGDVFYDDNAWLGLALSSHHTLTGSTEAEALSRRLLDYVLEGWSRDGSWVHPGGIRWKVAVTCESRNTCSNAPVAELAALIAMRDGDNKSLEWSKRIYAWVREALLGNDQLYLDRIDPDGTVHGELWTYNQGTMIGAGVLLHQATGEPDYVTQAESTAQAALTRFPLDELFTQDAAFNAVFFRNLFLLNSLLPNSDYEHLAMAYGDRMWSERRQDSTGLFSGGESFLNDTAPMIEIYALLAGAPPHD